MSSTESSHSEAPGLSRAQGRALERLEALYKRHHDGEEGVTLQAVLAFIIKHKQQVLARPVIDSVASAYLRALANDNGAERKFKFEFLNVLEASAKEDPESLLDPATKLTVADRFTRCEYARDSTILTRYYEEEDPSAKRRSMYLVAAIVALVAVNVWLFLSVRKGRRQYY